MKIAFIGGGNMATALIAGLAKRMDERGRIHVVDPNPEALTRLATDYGVGTAPAVDAELTSCDVVVLAVKPQQMREVAAQLAPHLGAQLVLSIAAGIRS